MNFINKHQDNIFSEKHQLVDEYYRGQDLVPMWVAETDYALPEYIKASLYKRIDHGGFGYSYIQDDTLSVLQEVFQTENIMLDNGIMKSVFEIIKCFTQESDSIVVFSPHYHHFITTIELANRPIKTSELLDIDNRYYIDFEDLESKISQSKVLLFCSPHNPTGRIWNKQELERVYDLCKKYDVLIISDEVHSTMNYHEFHTMQNFDNVIVLNSPSKTFNVAGLKQSFIIVENNRLFKQLSCHYQTNKIKSNNVVSLLVLSDIYRNGQKYQAEVIQYTKENLECCYQILLGHQVRFHYTESSFLLWIDLSKYFKSDQQLIDYMITNCKIAPTFGSTFGAKYKFYIRLNIGCERKLCINSLKKIVSGLDRYV
ncbi:aminotransferase class I/II-fold pyridoxal phosphate-dependent enzyme [Mollicutes bacterium LVI A0039]|nr:aminotransferase class I/II-fold pyridoxal phosphate-dependent enzyme [Mollicutes bacterium LVI A0039]